MKIGYPCINTTIGCKNSRTFRLKSYSEKRLMETVENNLVCLGRILRVNLKYNILFFRITSDLVPFASHPICKFDWQGSFRKGFKAIGDFVKKHGVRISMHPDQFTLINSIDKRVFENSVRELVYHAQVLDLMELDTSAKIQIHVGGTYRDKDSSMIRFVERFEKLDEIVKRRLTIENDDRRYSLRDCLQISAKTRIPVLFDVFHHGVNSSAETIQEAFGLFTKTWKENDGLPMVDYSSQMAGHRIGKHAEKINLEHFREFLDKSKPYDFDIMLEIKDKQISALKALEIASHDNRFLVAKNMHLKSHKSLD
jgi:UV DNA damage endonuclease